MLSHIPTCFLTEWLNLKIWLSLPFFSFLFFSFTYSHCSTSIRKNGCRTFSEFISLSWLVRRFSCHGTDLHFYLLFCWPPLQTYNFPYPLFRSSCWVTFTDLWVHLLFPPPLHRSHNIYCQAQSPLLSPLNHTLKYYQYIYGVCMYYNIFQIDYVFLGFQFDIVRYEWKNLLCTFMYGKFSMVW